MGRKESYSDRLKREGGMVASDHYQRNPPRRQVRITAERDAEQENA